MVDLRLVLQSVPQQFEIAKNNGQNVVKVVGDAARLAIGSGRFDIEGLSRALRFSNEGDSCKVLL